MASIDWHTRFVVGWKLANTMEASHAVEVLETAIRRYGKPEIVNADQGSQFTGEAWILAVEAHKIKTSHDGVGRCIDNIRMERLWWSIKYEHVHLYCHQTMWELEKGLEAYLSFYNMRRRHQGIDKLRQLIYIWRHKLIATLSRWGAAPHPGIFMKMFREGASGLAWRM